MSPVIRDFDLNEWRSMSNNRREMAALSAAQMLRDLETQNSQAYDECDKLRTQNEVAQNRLDLVHRRTEIALAILRDDEAGLTYNQLNQLAEVIWPKQIDMTQQPTVQPSHVENQFAELLHLGIVSFRELMKVVPVGTSSCKYECEECGATGVHLINASFELGELKQQIESFQLRAKDLLNKLYGRFFD